MTANFEARTCTKFQKNIGWYYYEHLPSEVRIAMQENAISLSNKMVYQFHINQAKRNSKLTLKFIELMTIELLKPERIEQ